jgi:hypothetical protein
MMDSKVFEKIFDAWNLATVASTVLEFFEGLKRIKARPER